MSSVETVYDGSDTSDYGPVRSATRKTALQKAADKLAPIRQGLVRNIIVKPRSCSVNFLAQSKAFMENFQGRNTGCKASLPRSQPKEHSALLDLPAEIREMIWEFLVEGHLITLEVHDTIRRAYNHIRPSDFRVTRRQALRASLREKSDAKNRPKCNFSIWGVLNGISISMLLVCKQMNREIEDVFFRKAVVEVNPKYSDYRYRQVTSEPLQQKGTLGVLSNIRFLSTTLRFFIHKPWYDMIEDISWFFRLLRHCPQIRVAQLMANFADWDTMHYDLEGDIIAGHMQLLASKALELLPKQPTRVVGPRPVTSVRNLVGGWDCWTDPAEITECWCTWTVAFVWRPENDARRASESSTDFHVPGTADWSNQILFTPRWCRRRFGVLFNQLEQKLAKPMSPPQTLLHMDAPRMQPHEFITFQVRQTQTNTLMKRMQRPWSETGQDLGFSKASTNIWGFLNQTA